jgi:glycosyltransferase involved in cell wall biosynthesis
MILAVALRKPLFVRHCGNWLSQQTRAEAFCRWFMTRFAGGRNVMLATGGADAPPSRQNPAILWTFATTMTQQELAACRAARRPRERRGRLIIVCRQEKRKGTAIVIESLPLIHQALPGATVDVVGAGTQLESLRDLATRLGLIDRVRFHGQVDHARVLDLLTQSDLLCYPTTCPEGFPKAVLEALACGVPVVTSPVSVLPSIVRRGCGVLLDEVTPSALARAVHEALVDETRYQEMSERAVQIAAEYSLERWQASVAELLREAWGRLRTEGNGERPQLDGDGAW